MKKIRDLMQKEVVTIGPEEPLKNAISKMTSGKFRRIPVVHEGMLVGIITDRDIRQALNSPMLIHERSQDEYLLSSVTVESSMTRKPLSTGPDADVVDAARIMEQQKIGGLPVVEEGRLVGIITISDLMDFLISHLEGQNV
ncbi:MAG TPA: CBS domain-containing protein [Deltaproteobacteria bacterium]|nr:CBS domain-containing protein [Deltaproteobacteria bacterium]